MPTRPTRATALLALLAAGTIAGCSASPSSSGGTSASARGTTRLAEPFTVDHAAWNAVGYRWDWTSRPPLITGARIAFADAYDDLIVVQDTGSMVSVIEAPTGKVRWNKQVRETNTRFLGNTRVDNSLFVTNETDLFEFDLATGNTLDRTGLSTIATTAPVMFGNLAILGAAGGRLIAVDVRNDIRVWEYQFDGLIETRPTRVDDWTVSAISTLGQIRTLDVESATSKGTARISGDASEPMVSDGYITYVASLDQSLYAFDAVENFRLWRKRSSAPVTVQPVLINGVLYATTSDTGLMAIQGDTGEVRWTNPSIGGWVVTTSKGDLMVWNGRDLMRVDAERGDLIAQATLSGVSGLRSNTPFDGEIYAISSEGAVARFSPR
ncbi:MAG: hypothetical protein D6692_10125 [Planctomycetota bacterium]|nr:MAG: hypothetical protein D6692_10125 [Planctomycetota bacterium]